MKPALFGMLDWVNICLGMHCTLCYGGQRATVWNVILNQQLDSGNCTVCVTVECILVFASQGM